MSKRQQRHTFMNGSITICARIFRGNYYWGMGGRTSKGCHFLWRMRRTRVGIVVGSAWPGINVGPRNWQLGGNGCVAPTLLVDAVECHLLPVT
jgi:hypothetical protein